MKLGFDTPGTSVKCDYTFKVLHLCVLAKKRGTPQGNRPGICVCVCIKYTYT